MSTPEQWDEAVRHSMGYGAMSRGDPMTELVTDVALHSEWPSPQQRPAAAEAAGRPVARPLASAGCAGPAWRAYLSTLAAAVAAACGWLLLELCAICRAWGA